MAYFGTAHFKKSIEEGIGILNGDHFGGRRLGGSQKTHDPPRIFIRQADVSDLSRFDVVVQCIEDGFKIFFPGIVGVVSKTSYPKSVGITLRPVQLVEVDIVGLQSLEALVDGLVDMGFFKAEVFADVFGIITRPCNFGGQDDFVSMACFFEPCSDDALGFPLGLGIRRDWIEFGYIKKINPLFKKNFKSS